jgi:hypothetical protein
MDQMKARCEAGTCQLARVVDSRRSVNVSRALVLLGVMMALPFTSIATPLCTVLTSTSHLCTDSVSFNLTTSVSSTPGITSSISFAKFNSSMGTLTGLDVTINPATISLTTSGVRASTSITPTSFYYKYDGANGTSKRAPAAAVKITDVSGDVLTDYAGSQTYSFTNNNINNTGAAGTWAKRTLNKTEANYLTANPYVCTGLNCTTTNTFTVSSLYTGTTPAPQSVTTHYATQQVLNNFKAVGGGAGTLSLTPYIAAARQNQNLNSPSTNDTITIGGAILYTYISDDPPPTPETTTLVLLGSGLAFLGFIGRKRIGA